MAAERFGAVEAYRAHKLVLVDSLRRVSFFPPSQRPRRRVVAPAHRHHIDVASTRTTTTFIMVRIHARQRPPAHHVPPLTPGTPDPQAKGFQHQVRQDKRQEARQAQSHSGKSRVPHLQALDLCLGVLGMRRCFPRGDPHFLLIGNK